LAPKKGMIEKENQVIFPKFTWETGIGMQLLHLHLALRGLSNDIEAIDFSIMKFTPPLLSVFYSSTISESHTEIGCKGQNSYLDTIHFPNGLYYTSEDELLKILNRYHTKTYLPIIKFRTDSAGDFPRIREKILSHVLRSIRSIANLPTNYHSAVSYLISELTDNICEHSAHPIGYLAFQYYKESRHIDICLADRGIGLLGSYQNYTGDRDFSMITNHLEAVDAAIKGRSTKKIAEERGFGIATSRRILVDGLGGNFVYLSGNGLLINEELTNFGTKFNGSIVLIRIPVGTFREEFDWVNYVE
jgi:hypothetical protein